MLPELRVSIALEAVRLRRPSMFVRVRTAGRWLGRCQSKGRPWGLGSSCTHTLKSARQAARKQ